MKKVCIKTNKNYWLTIGKTYEVISDVNYDYGYYDNNGYNIINDNGDDCWYEKECFKSLAEIRNETIDKLLEDES